MAREGVLGAWSRLNLVTRIVIGLVLAVVVALVTRHFGGGAEGWDAVIERTGALPAGWPSDVMAGAQLLGDLFVGALKAVAPVLVLVLVMAAIAQHEHGTETNIRPILVLYLVGTFAAALVAVAASFMFPSNLSLEGVKHATEVARPTTSASWAGACCWGCRSVMPASTRGRCSTTRPRPCPRWCVS